MKVSADDVLSSWPTVDETRGSCASPGIYRIIIEDVGEYIGRFTRAYRPLREYRNNVRKIAEEKPYRKSDPTGFRYIHRAVFKALKDQRSVAIEIVENVEPALLNSRERFWIEQIPVAVRLNDHRRTRG